VLDNEKSPELKQL